MGLRTTPTVDDRTPDPDSDTLLIHATGNGTCPLTVTAVAEGNDGVRVRRINGSTVAYTDFQSREQIPAEAFDGASRVEPISEASGASLVASDGAGGTFG